MIDTERINSQLSPPHEKAITSVDPGGGGLMINRGSTVNFHLYMKRQSYLLILGGDRGNFVFNFSPGDRMIAETVQEWTVPTCPIHFDLLDVGQGHKPSSM